MQTHLKITDDVLRRIANPNGLTSIRTLEFALNSATLEAMATNLSQLAQLTYLKLHLLQPIAVDEHHHVADHYARLHSVKAVSLVLCAKLPSNVLSMMSFQRLFPSLRVLRLVHRTGHCAFCDYLHQPNYEPKLVLRYARRKANFFVQDCSLLEQCYLNEQLIYAADGDLSLGAIGL